MVLEVALFSKPGTAKVFFTFQKEVEEEERSGGKKKETTSPGVSFRPEETDAAQTSLNLLYISETLK